MVNSMPWSDTHQGKCQVSYAPMLGSCIALVNDEYLATTSNLEEIKAFESFSWDELDGGHVSFIKS
jgi:hypothetical protein